MNVPEAHEGLKLKMEPKILPTIQIHFHPCQKKISVFRIFFQHEIFIWLAFSVAQLAFIMTQLCSGTSITLPLHNCFIRVVGHALPASSAVILITVCHLVVLTHVMCWHSVTSGWTTGSHKKTPESHYPLSLCFCSQKTEWNLEEWRSVRCGLFALLSNVSMISRTFSPTQENIL